MVFFIVVVLAEGVLGLMEDFEGAVFEEIFFSADSTTGVFLMVISEEDVEEIFWSFCGRLALF